MCCYRSNILAPGEKEKIDLHLEKILPYMTPVKRKILEDRGGFVADCVAQCPDGCELNEDEVNAMARSFDLSDDFRCNMIVRAEHSGDGMDSCIFLSRNASGENHCSIHAYAIDAGINWMEIKPVDCIQYPLAVFREGDKTILAPQTTSFLAHLPCHDSGLGPWMYQSMESTIRFLLGGEFFESLDRYVLENVEPKRAVGT
ncbi:MAG: DUF3109 domain-containing protein [Nitrospirae bacterium]|nr:DUF3109 domain-containing protein [Nitrospirota bacterium]